MASFTLDPVKCIENVVGAQSDVVSTSLESDWKSFVQADSGDLGGAVKTQADAATHDAANVTTLLTAGTVK